MAGSIRRDVAGQSLPFSIERDNVNPQDHTVDTDAAAGKKKYSAPSLKYYGDVRDLTMGTTGLGQQESGIDRKGELESEGGP